MASDWMITDMRSLFSICTTESALYVIGVACLHGMKSFSGQTEIHLRPQVVGYIFATSATSESTSRKSCIAVRHMMRDSRR